jgi:hypothetical protein
MTSPMNKSRTVSISQFNRRLRQLSSDFQAKTLPQADYRQARRLLFAELSEKPPEPTQTAPVIKKIVQVQPVFPPHMEPVKNPHQRAYALAFFGALIILGMLLLSYVMARYSGL